MNPPRIRAQDIEDFVSSEKGKRSIYFIYNYLSSNAEIRRKRQKGLKRNYENVSESRVTEDLCQVKILAKRNFCIEIINQSLMALEDLAAFCLAFEEPLEDLPKKIVNYRTREIYDFYNKSFSKGYISDLLLLPEPSKVTNNKELIKKIEKIQEHNIEAFLFYFSKFVEYRDHFNRLYSKNKHGNPLFFSFLPEKKYPDIDEEDQNVVIFYDSDSGTGDIEPKATILGRNTLERSIIIMRKATDILVTLLHRRLDYLKYKGTFPPTFVFGENPLRKEEWMEYEEEIESLLPFPIQIEGKPNFQDVDIAEQERWLHSKDWEKKWFKHKEWGYEKGSKVKKSY